MSQTNPTPSGKPAAGDDRRLVNTIGWLVFFAIVAIQVWWPHRRSLPRPVSAPANHGSYLPSPVPYSGDPPIYEGLSDDEKRAAQRTERPLGENADRFDRKAHGLTPLP
jgi:hypothetical protein